MESVRRTLPLLLVFVLAVSACSNGSSDDTQPTESGSAGSLEATLGLDGDHALVGRLVIDTEAPSTPKVTVTGEERDFEIPVAQEGTHHEIPVAGLRAESAYTVVVADGTDEVSLELETSSLPDDFPEITIAAAETAAMSPGFTLFDLIDFTQPPTDDDGNPIPQPEPDEPPRAGLMVAVDNEGEVVWYHRADHSIGDVRMLDDGTILHEYNDTAARRINLFGETIDEWAGQIIADELPTDDFGRQVVGDEAIVVPTDSMHHEVNQLSNGNIAVLSTELRTYDGFTEALCGDTEPGFENFEPFDGSYDLISDIVTEFTPEGEIVFEAKLADLLDPINDPRDQNVCGLPQGAVFPNWMYRAQGFDQSRDWTHANAVIEDPERNAFIVSIRHLDAVIAISRDTGELLWRLGPGGDFEMVGDGEFQFHQHAPEIQADGTLLLYDNGNFRPGTSFEFGSGLPFPTSRAVQYRINDDGPPDTWTVEQVWEYESRVDGSTAFAGFVGDADRLANGSVLITNGGYGEDRDDGVTSQIVEVVPEGTDGGTEVFDLRMANDRGWVIYRAERVEDLYPAG